MLSGLDFRNKGTRIKPGEKDMRRDDFLMIDIMNEVPQLPDGILNRLATLSPISPHNAISGMPSPSSPLPVSYDSDPFAARPPMTPTKKVHGFPGHDKLDESARYRTRDSFCSESSFGNMSYASSFLNCDSPPFYDQQSYLHSALNSPLPPHSTSIIRAHPSSPSTKHYENVTAASSTAAIPPFRELERRRTGTKRKSLVLQDNNVSPSLNSTHKRTASNSRYGDSFNGLENSQRSSRIQVRRPGTRLQQNSLRNNFGNEDRKIKNSPNPSSNPTRRGSRSRTRSQYNLLSTSPETERKISPSISQSNNLSMNHPLIKTRNRSLKPPPLNVSIKHDRTNLTPKQVRFSPQCAPLSPKAYDEELELLSGATTPTADLTPKARSFSHSEIRELMNTNKASPLQSPSAPPQQIEVYEKKILPTPPMSTNRPKSDIQPLSSDTNLKLNARRRHRYRHVSADSFSSSTMNEKNPIKTEEMETVKSPTFRTQLLAKAFRRGMPRSQNFESRSQTQKTQKTLSRSKSNPTIDPVAPDESKVGGPKWVNVFANVLGLRSKKRAKNQAPGISKADIGLPMPINTSLANDAVAPGAPQLSRLQSMTSLSEEDYMAMIARLSLRESKLWDDLPAPSIRHSSMAEFMTERRLPSNFGVAEEPFPKSHESTRFSSSDMSHMTYNRQEREKIYLESSLPVRVPSVSSFTRQVLSQVEGPENSVKVSGLGLGDDDTVPLDERQNEKFKSNVGRQNNGFRSSSVDTVSTVASSRKSPKSRRRRHSLRTSLEYESKSIANKFDTSITEYMKDDSRRLPTIMDESNQTHLRNSSLSSKFSFDMSAFPDVSKLNDPSMLKKITDSRIERPHGMIVTNKKEDDDEVDDDDDDALARWKLFSKAGTLTESDFIFSIKNGDGESRFDGQEEKMSFVRMPSQRSYRFSWCPSWADDMTSLVPSVTSSPPDSAKAKSRELPVWKGDSSNFSNIDNSHVSNTDDSQVKVNVLECDTAEDSKTTTPTNRPVLTSLQEENLESVLVNSFCEQQTPRICTSFTKSDPQNPLDQSNDLNCLGKESETHDIENVKSTDLLTKFISEPEIDQEKTVIEEDGNMEILSRARSTSEPEDVGETLISQEPSSEQKKIWVEPAPDMEQIDDLTIPKKPTSEIVKTMENKRLVKTRSVEVESISIESPHTEMAKISSSIEFTSEKKQMEEISMQSESTSEPEEMMGNSSHIESISEDKLLEMNISNPSVSPKLEQIWNNSSRREILTTPDRNVEFAELKREYEFLLNQMEFLHHGSVISHHHEPPRYRKGLRISSERIINSMSDLANSCSTSPTESMSSLTSSCSSSRDSQHFQKTEDTTSPFSNKNNKDAMKETVSRIQELFSALDTIYRETCAKFEIYENSREERQKPFEDDYSENKDDDFEILSDVNGREEMLKSLQEFGCWLEINKENWKNLNFILGKDAIEELVPPDLSIPYPILKNDTNIRSMMFLVNKLHEERRGSLASSTASRSSRGDRLSMRSSTSHRSSLTSLSPRSSLTSTSPKSSSPTRTSPLCTLITKNPRSILSSSSSPASLVLPSPLYSFPPKNARSGMSSSSPRLSSTLTSPRSSLTLTSPRSSLTLTSPRSSLTMTSPRSSLNSTNQRCCANNLLAPLTDMTSTTLSKRKIGFAGVSPTSRKGTERVIGDDRLSPRQSLCVLNSNLSSPIHLSETRRRSMQSAMETEDSLHLKANSLYHLSKGRRMSMETTKERVSLLNSNPDKLIRLSESKRKSMEITPEMENSKRNSLVRVSDKRKSMEITTETGNLNSKRNSLVRLSERRRSMEVTTETGSLFNSKRNSLIRLSNKRRSMEINANMLNSNQNSPNILSELSSGPMGTTETSREKLTPTLMVNALTPPIISVKAEGTTAIPETVRPSISIPKKAEPTIIIPKKAGPTIIIPKKAEPNKTIPEKTVPTMTTKTKPSLMPNLSHTEDIKPTTFLMNPQAFRSLFVRVAVVAILLSILHVTKWLDTFAIGAAESAFWSREL